MSKTIDESTLTGVTPKSRNGHVLVTAEDYPTPQSFRFALAVAGTPELIKCTFGKPFLLTNRKVTLVGVDQIVMTTHTTSSITVTTEPTTPVIVHNRDMIRALPSSALVYRGGAGEFQDYFLDEAILNTSHGVDLMPSPRALPAGDYYILVDATTAGGLLLVLEWTEL